MRSKFKVRGTRTPGIKSQQKHVGCSNCEITTAKLVVKCLTKYFQSYGLHRTIRDYGLGLVEIKVYHNHISDLQKRIPA